MGNGGLSSGGTTVCIGIWAYRFWCARVTAAVWKHTRGLFLLGGGGALCVQEAKAQVAQLSLLMLKSDVGSMSKYLLLSDKSEISDQTQSTPLHVHTQLEILLLLTIILSMHIFLTLYTTK